MMPLHCGYHQICTNISGPTKFVSHYDPCAICTQQNFKLASQPYGPCFVRINLSIESCFVLLLGCFLGGTLKKILLCFVVVKVSDQGNIPISEKGH